MPGALVLVLLLLLGGQLWLADAAPEFPPALPVGASRSNLVIPDIRPVEPARVIFARPLFAPRQSLAAASGAAAPPAVGGATVAGSVTVRGRSFAVVRRANGAVVNMAVGGTIEGWRLIALRSGSALFAKGRERRELAFGAAAVPVGEEEEPAE